MVALQKLWCQSCPVAEVKQEVFVQTWHSPSRYSAASRYGLQAQGGKAKTTLHADYFWLGWYSFVPWAETSWWFFNDHKLSTGSTPRLFGNEDQEWTPAFWQMVCKFLGQCTSIQRKILLFLCFLFSQWLQLVVWNSVFRWSTLLFQDKQFVCQEAQQELNSATGSRQLSSSSCRFSKTYMLMFLVSLGSSSAS